MVKSLPEKSGSFSTYDNLRLIKNKKPLIAAIGKEDRSFLFEDLDGVISDVLADRIWDMIYERFRIYESI